MNIIIAREHGLTFEGHPDDGKAIAEHLSDLAYKAGEDLMQTLSDFCFNIEVEYQMFYGKGEDDFGW